MRGYSDTFFFFFIVIVLSDDFVAMFRDKTRYPIVEPAHMVMPVELISLCILSVCCFASLTLK